MKFPIPRRLWGPVAEGLGSGLQNLLQRFKSAPDLQIRFQLLQGQRATAANRAQDTPGPRFAQGEYSNTVPPALLPPPSFVIPYK